jgi:hypothetical protein
MSEFENVFKRKELHDMFAAGEIRPLDDLYLLEDVALTIKELEKQKDFYKDYKKKKSQDVSDAVKVIENKVAFYKSIMVSTLESNNEKSVKFPGSCAVSSRNQKAKWVVNDEEEFIAVLKEAQKAGEDVDDVLEEVVQYNIRKREASKLIAIWEQSGKLEDFLKKAKKSNDDIIVKESEKKTVSIKFLEVVDEGMDDSAEDVDIPVKEGASSDNMGDYDSL